jgi:flavin reductase (DIM6/NTAB) family NADH-FMN oxidoreductase RutF
MSVAEIVFASLVQGVYVVTTRFKDRINGMTAAWVSQVSFNPLLVMVSIAPPRYSHDLIKESGVLAINVLTRDQVELGKRFGYKSGRQVDKFAGLDYTTAKTGAPILPQSYAYLDLKLVSTFPAGDHTLFVGEVVDAAILHPEAQPLIFQKSDFF